jgi:rRNA processing protein Gar1
MRNVKLNITDKINAFRWYKCRPRINGYVMQNVIGNITNPFIGVSAIARISISDQVEDNIKNK